MTVKPTKPRQKMAREGYFAKLAALFGAILQILFVAIPKVIFLLKIFKF